MKREKAHFFWHGNPMSEYENKCIKSFVNHNFEVHLWTYDELLIPNGIILEDATRFFEKETINTLIQAGVKGSLPSFASLFRLELLSIEEGWWFDTDCICLKDQEEFRKLSESKRIVAGWEDDLQINNGVLKFSERELAAKACLLRDEILRFRNRDLEWGDIGPRLITLFVKNNDLESDILPPEYFYPEHYSNALDVLNPKKTELLIEKTKNSFVYHYWNEIFKRNNVNKSILPPEGSFLRAKFDQKG